MTDVSVVRLATRDDEPEIMQLFHVMHAEGGMQPYDEECVRATFAKAWDRRGASIGVIGPPGDIRAMIYLMLTRSWYTSKSHIEELFSFVRPDCRIGNHSYGETLIRFAQKQSDDLGVLAKEPVPLLIGVLTNSRMAGKVRLYRRILGYPVGAFFVHGAKWKVKPCDEDFWRVSWEPPRTHGKQRANGSADEVAA